MSGNICGLDEDSGSVADSENAGTDVSISEAFEPQITIWDCPEMNLALREVTDGAFVSGWTCGHFPLPPRGAANFFKHRNAMIALHHILKNSGQNIKLCQGNIPFQKKQQCNALYNLGIMKKRNRQGRSKEMHEEIDKYQDRTPAAHFPAITVLSAASLVRKGPPKEMNSSQNTMSLSITSTLQTKDACSG